MSPSAVPALTMPIDAAVRVHQAGRLDEAETLYRQVLFSEPGHLDALHLLGVVQIQKGRPGEAVDLISQSLAGNPENYYALNHLGEAYRALHFFDEAMTCFQRALELKTDFPQAYTNMGNVYQVKQRFDLAMGCYAKALELDPQYAEAHANLANALAEQGKLDDAIAGYRRALELRLDSPIVLFNLGNAYKTLRRYDEAIDSYGKAISLRNDFVQAHVALGRALHESGRKDEAVEQFARGCSVAPENVELQWGMVQARLALVHESSATMAADRAEFEQGLDALDRWFHGSRVELGYDAVGSQQPFHLAYYEQNNRDLLSRYGALCNRLAGHWQTREALQLRKHRRRSRIRLGIVSAHIRDHSVWHALIKGLCEHIDENLVELHLFSLSVINDHYTDVARRQCFCFDQGARPALSWARTILDRELDVLLFPEIGMDATAAKLANLRLAPVQAVMWGHPETSGLPTIDYFLSAEDFEPADAQEHYRERLVRLPHLGCCYRPLETISADLDFSSLGIDASKPLFVCPGAPFKYLPQHDAVLARIADRLGPCQFLVFQYPLEEIFRRLKTRLSHTFAAAGLDYERYVVELPWLTPAGFNSLMNQADVYLDTIGFSGFNTAMQAVEAGIPIVTVDGHFMRGRLASGILRRLDMQETIAPSDDAYANIAVTLAQDDQRRARLRETLRSHRVRLYDDVDPVRALEKFLRSVTAS